MHIKKHQNETSITLFTLLFDTRQTVTKVVPQLTLCRGENKNVLIQYIKSKHLIFHITTRGWRCTSQIQHNISKMEHKCVTYFPKGHDKGATDETD